jgi:hypothetical protein
MKSAALLLALLAPWAAAEGAARPAATAADTFRERVELVTKTAADPAASPAAVWERGQNLYLNNVNIRVEPNLRGWDFGGRELGDGQRVEVKELVEYGRQKTTDLGIEVPEPLRDSVNDLTALDAAGRVREGSASDMGPSQMGRIRYNEQDCSSGDVDLHELMPGVIGVIGKAFGYSTFAHEGRHLREHRRCGLSDEHVKLNETLAFQSQYDWLRLVDPHGERLAYARAWVGNLIRRHGHGSIIDGSQAYLNHLAELRVAGDADAASGSDRNIRELVDRLGYEEGHQHGAQGAHPTRS